MYDVESTVETPMRSGRKLQDIATEPSPSSPGAMFHVASLEIEKYSEMVQSTDFLPFIESDSSSEDATKESRDSLHIIEENSESNNDANSRGMSGEKISATIMLVEEIPESPGTGARNLNFSQDASESMSVGKRKSEVQLIIERLNRGEEMRAQEEPKEENNQENLPSNAPSQVYDYNLTGKQLLLQLYELQKTSSSSPQSNLLLAYKVDLMQALRATTSILPHYPSHNEMNDLGYATRTLKNFHDRLNEQEFGHEETGSVLNHLRSIQPSTRFVQALEVLEEDVIPVLYAIASENLLEDDQEDVFDVMHLLSGLAKRMKKREQITLAAALRRAAGEKQDETENNGVDSFAQNLIDVQKKAEKVKRKSTSSEVCSTIVVKKEEVGSPRTPQEVFLKMARKIFSSIIIKHDEAHAIARMMISLKNAGDYQNQESVCEEEILKLQQELPGDIFSQIGELMEAYCHIHLTTKEREQFVDMIFGCVVEENESDFSDSDWSESDDDESFFDDGFSGVAIVSEYQEPDIHFDAESKDGDEWMFELVVESAKGDCDNWSTSTTTQDFKTDDEADFDLNDDGPLQRGASAMDLMEDNDVNDRESVYSEASDEVFEVASADSSAGSVFEVASADDDSFNLEVASEDESCGIDVASAGESCDIEVASDADEVAGTEDAKIQLPEAKEEKNDVTAFIEEFDSDDSDSEHSFTDDISIGDRNQAPPIPEQLSIPTEALQDASPIEENTNQKYEEPFEVMDNKKGVKDSENQVDLEESRHYYGEMELRDCDDQMASPLNEKRKEFDDGLQMKSRTTTKRSSQSRLRPRRLRGSLSSTMNLKDVIALAEEASWLQTDIESKIKALEDATFSTDRMKSKEEKEAITMNALVEGARARVKRRTARSELKEETPKTRMSAAFLKLKESQNRISSFVDETEYGEAVSESQDKKKKTCKSKSKGKSSRSRFSKSVKDSEKSVDAASTKPKRKRKSSKSKSAFKVTTEGDALLSVAAAAASKMKKGRSSKKKSSAKLQDDTKSKKKTDDGLWTNVLSESTKKEKRKRGSTKTVKKTEKPGRSSSTDTEVKPKRKRSKRKSKGKRLSISQDEAQHQC